MATDPTTATTWAELKYLEKMQQREQRVAWIKAMSEGAESAAQVAEKLGMDGGSLRKLLISLDVEITKASAGLQTDWARVERYRGYAAQKMTAADVAAIEGITDHAARTFAKKHKIAFYPVAAKRRDERLRREAEVAKSKPKPEPKVKTPLDRMKEMAREESRRMARVGLG